MTPSLNVDGELSTELQFDIDSRTKMNSQTWPREVRMASALAVARCPSSIGIAI
jgi:hypothetical protein